MTPYEELLEIAKNEGVTVVDYDLGERLSGLYCDGCVLINKNSDTAEKYCTLAEELVHHYTATGNIVETDTIDKCRQEQQGRRLGYEMILPIQDILNVIIDGYDTLPLVAEQLDVTPEYLQEALIYYGKKYGPEAEYGDYIVTFSNESLIVHPILDDII